MKLARGRRGGRGSSHPAAWWWRYLLVATFTLLAGLLALLNDQMSSNSNNGADTETIAEIRKEDHEQNEKLVYPDNKRFHLKNHEEISDKDDDNKIVVNVGLPRT
eukprot:CAMPEP_0172567712 /NCGR_PEP_ID=MMETSP1067-20121228/116882_1 /TAXON_ID=265564 ORGANISM="Thalassiosira punctigera, Strain Tpunct2005C2" /NCGR_SAMPLE_ID=MMETSP1067 /ASSEMBLY_ACC=CAM_ASM_000444 /LENGTH=104 /DNA_ID=CAMNT_0013359123 /DNA_START=84 /DNA_END=395 /DNA_ORIENTATION=-